MIPYYSKNSTSDISARLADIILSLTHHYCILQRTENDQQSRVFVNPQKERVHTIIIIASSRVLASYFFWKYFPRKCTDDVYAFILSFALLRFLRFVRELYFHRSNADQHQEVEKLLYKKV